MGSFMWNSALILEIPNQFVLKTFRTKLKEKLEKILQGQITRKSFMEYILDWYCKLGNEYSLILRESFEKIAMKVLETGASCRCESFNDSEKIKYGVLMSNLCERDWARQNELAEKFRLSNKCQVNAREAAVSIVNIKENIEIGNITVKDIEEIEKKPDTFIKACATIFSYKGKPHFDEKRMLVMIQIRSKELKETRNIQAAIFNLVQATFNVHSCNLNISDLVNETSILKDICVPLTTLSGDIKYYKPKVKLCDLTDDEIAALPKIQRISDSFVFLDLWKTQCSSNKEKIVPTIQHLLKSVWRTVFPTWNDLFQRLKSGSITFEEFDKYFSNYDTEVIKKEMTLYSDGENNQWISERMQQIHQHRQLNTCLKGAKVILEFVQIFDLKGDFSPIEKIVKMRDDKQMKIQDLDKSFLEACDVLCDISDNQIVCLQTFIECKELVSWIQSAAPDLQQLAVFVDLATISAGEWDMEVDRVNCFQSATTGYAPLIFNIEKECDYKHFLGQCKYVWKELDADPKLPVKFKDTKRELVWLESVKKAQGSVEISAMEQAKAINNSGIYLIGSFSPSTLKQKLNVDDVLQLHIQDEKVEARLRRQFHYKELQELQSKLMLIAGKAKQGNEDVERFTNVFDTVVRLCNIYIKLIEAGCILFSNWHVKFLCDPKRPVCAFVNFGYGKDYKQLKGRRDDNDDVTTLMPDLATFLENSLHKWSEFINDKREKYPRLNFYTMDQLVTLQKELAKVQRGSDHSLQVYQLLSLTKENCDQEDLVNALGLASNCIEKIENKQSNALTRDRQEEIHSGSEQFIQEMMKVGNTRKTALAALKEGIEETDIAAGYLWCLEHEHDEEIEDKNRFKASLRTTTMTKYSSLISEENTESETQSLLSELDKVWQSFVESVSSSVSDYLSIEHLGMTLQELTFREPELKRDFMKYFKTNEPNVLICQKADVINTVLSIYCHSSREPLPRPEEILFCTEQTTADEIDIFWRRSFYDKSGKIYCLADCGVLKHNVSEIAERRLNVYMQKELPYQLVIVCDSDTENQSKIVAALNNYSRADFSFIQNNKDLRNHIEGKLTCHTSAKAYGAHADMKNCTVRIVKSRRAGVGKTLYKRRTAEKLKSFSKDSSVITIPLHARKINVDEVMATLLQNTLAPKTNAQRLFHFDFAQEVVEEVDYLLFQLIILGCLTDSHGNVWRKLPSDLYLIETTPLLIESSQSPGSPAKCLHRCLDILPDVMCRPPRQCLSIYTHSNIPYDYKGSDLLFDEEEFRSEVFQRPYQYLTTLDPESPHTISDVNLNETFGTIGECLQTVLRYCGIFDPSWAEVRNFVWFLDTQLKDFEKSDYISEAASADLPGFPVFVLKFLIQMSRDFATRSLDMSEETVNRAEICEKKSDLEKDLKQFQFRRTWESSPHPYLFFNPDHNTLTFVGFSIDRRTGDLVDYKTGAILERKILPRRLGHALYQNKVNMQENFDELTRQEKLKKLCTVMGLDVIHDPDSTYELTMDNVKKILAIYMRFRCDIPVIIMGETGCGKTRLVDFLCKLQCPPEVKTKNMLIIKVHGGIKRQDIIDKIKEAEELAKENSKHGIYTVLFFDEANTTEDIGVIKEIMCDKTVSGKPLDLSKSLKIVAACNPYRKHSDEMINRLEQAGLGYNVSAENTKDKLGRLPMRHLVYRVQPLPQSMLPLVWDFGQLDNVVEEMYIRQIVLRYINDKKLPNFEQMNVTLSRILTKAQEYMRTQKGECSFVSLRDVERTLLVMSWFLKTREVPDNPVFFCLGKIQTSEDDDTKENFQVSLRCNLTKALVLALGVCYHACLSEREKFRNHIVTFFKDEFLPLGSGAAFLDIISSCQEEFLRGIPVGKNIAKNKALRENVFMMAICIELRIPLFLVGKPGSSKSLAKTIISDAMQGLSSHTQLYKSLKKATMVSFQCSHLSVAEGILNTFEQAANYQKDRDLERFVSVVILEEVGLAEDSPKMPLKILHPLLESGCPGNASAERYKKVAFIGLSNWALDPAKMNRGILVQRETPDLVDLKETARDIHGRDNAALVEFLIEPLTEGYLEVFNATLLKREFFGLRDFYSLIKMVSTFATKSRKKPTWMMLMHSVLRNFGGLEDPDIKPWEIFEKKLSRDVTKSGKTAGDPECTPTGLIEASLTGREDGSRYLLLLTKNYESFSVLQHKLSATTKRHQMHDEKQTVVTIFGSSFPCDQEYTQVCRNINRIKVCMETGELVVLLNLENLYESLYDALNQSFVKFGDQNYVDLGLGSHRVKCRVHKNFRLVVIAEINTVLMKFPIPLINRLEKHFLTITSVLSSRQLRLSKRLENWIYEFVEQATQPNSQQKMQVGEVFIGYHQDSCASIILHLCQKMSDDKELGENDEEIFRCGQEVFLLVATPDAVLRQAIGTDTGTEMKDIYFHKQKHNSLVEYLKHYLQQKENLTKFKQITTHSKLLSIGDLNDLLAGLRYSTDCKNSSDADQPASSQDLSDANIAMLSLKAFDTEQQFCSEIKFSLEKNFMVIIQCDFGSDDESLIACARHCVQDVIEQMKNDISSRRYVILIIHLPRKTKYPFSGFQCGIWESVHIDELRPWGEDIPHITDMVKMSISDLLENVTDETMKGEKNEIRMQREQDLMHDATESLFPDNARSVQEYTDANSEDSIFSEHEKVCDERKPDVQKKLKFIELLKSSLQVSLTLVRDQDDDKKDQAGGENRHKERLNIVHSHLLNDEFFFGICKILKTLLKEKEESMSEDEIRSWITSEASSRQYIYRVGTFRKSLIQCIEDQIIPILAGIISHIDVNNNLSILKHQEKSSWKVKLFLQILLEQKAVGISYRSLKKAFKETPFENNKPEVSVKRLGYRGKKFQAKLPFSWLLFEIINKVLRMSSTMKSVGIIDNCARILEEYPLVRNFLTCDLPETCIGDYINDFVFMVYPVQSKDEFRVVYENIETGSRVTLKGKEHTILHRFIAVHDAYEKSAFRYSNFKQIVLIWPECCSKMAEYSRKEIDVIEEETLDVIGLSLLLQNLEPENETFKDARGKRQKWLQNVNRIRFVTESILESLKEKMPGTRPLGEFCKKYLADISCRWKKIAVVKLFIRHVCSVKEDQSSKCMVLWMMLKTLTDTSSIDSLDRLEKFLKICMREVMKKVYGEQMKCTNCECGIFDQPVKLPCDHVICLKCYKETSILGKRVCPSCQKPFPEDLKYNSINIDSAVEKELKSYQQSCNDFFMAIVSNLCFSDDAVPRKDVVEKLMTYVVVKTKSDDPTSKATKQFSLVDVDPVVDTTPVLRTFLLQQLLRANFTEVKIHLKKYIVDTSNLFSRNEDVSGDFYSTVVYCLEDSYLQKCSRVMQLEEDNNEEINRATDFLCEAQKQNMGMDAVDEIFRISEARFGLRIAAKYLYKIIVEKSMRRTEETRQLFKAAVKLCMESSTRYSSIFVIKQLCLDYNIDVFRDIYSSEENDMKKCMEIPELIAQKVPECEDRFIICGPSYVSIRENITQCILGKSMLPLENELSVTRLSDDEKGKICSLAIFREVTLSFLYPDSGRKFTSEGLAWLEKYIRSSTLFTNQVDLIISILRNEIFEGDSLLKIKVEMPVEEQNIACLLFHLYITLSRNLDEAPMLGPLYNLLFFPDKLKESFLPTMPQDDSDKIRNILFAAERELGNTPMSYACPDGHIYFVGECGKPEVVGRCPDCRKEIGGHEKKLLETNSKDNGNDKTKLGHILGSPEARNSTATPERKLLPKECAILRFFTNAAMYLGACSKLEDVSKMVYPSVSSDKILPFLFKHIQVDIRTLVCVLGKNEDEVYLILHGICQRLGYPITSSDEFPHQLNTKSDREEWEFAFANFFLKPTLKELETIVSEYNKYISEDERLGSDPLLRILVEEDISRKDLKDLALFDNPAMWRCRKAVTVQNITSLILNSTSEEKWPLLHMFLKEEKLLRAIRYVPSIIKLQQNLIRKHEKKLERAKASTLFEIIVTEDEKDQHEVQEQLKLVKDFSDAWSCVRDELMNFQFPTTDGFKQIQGDTCNFTLNEKCPISYFLPTFSDEGLCSYGLLYFLLNKQNEFLKKYSKVGNTFIGFKDLPRVSLSDLTASHLISFHPERDILPIVLANSQYMFEVGKGLQTDYNYTEIECTIVDRFLYSKSVILLETLENFAIMTYKSETTNATIFRELRLKVKQEELSSSIFKKIEEEIDDHPEAATAIQNLDIAIQFLTKTGSKPDMYIEQYMIEKILMEKPFEDHHRTMKSCQCKHVQDLWIALMIVYTKGQASYPEDMFKTVKETFKVKLSQEQKDFVEEMSEGFLLEKFNILIEKLFGCIMLCITIPEDDKCFDSSDGLKKTLQNFCIHPPYDVLIPKEKKINILELIEKFPDGELKLENKHAVDLWIILYGKYSRMVS
ncbi:E3 ubiquitin-protein ligase rnf213-alpha-like [Saccostrea cucullata]|uniref:E3 ubiquitin-protein ligase rnf213-alpha-like n=1 Tax=Saccostrea cuccullata TaxID=36930 RepID=UPI002ED15064